MAKVYNLIDVSYWQGDIDWNKAKKEIDGAMIRAGFGTNTLDKKFERNIKACNDLGIPCGVYWFSYACSAADAKAEAKRCLDAVKPYKLELPICCDFEYDSIEYQKKQGITPSKKLSTAIVKAFCAEIEKAGYYAMIYTNADFSGKYFDNISAYDLWYAAWTAAPNSSKPPKTCGIWQYTSGGSVSGISGDVDKDFAYKDYPSIIRKAGLNKLVTESKAETVKKWAISKGITDGSKTGDAPTRAEVWEMLYKLNGGK